MVAVIRLKRRCDEDPTETLILNCKKIKLEESDRSKCTSTTFQRIGTIHGEGNGISHSHSKESVQFQKRNFMDSQGTLQKRRQINSNRNRNQYTVTSCGKSEECGITLNVENETVDPNSNEQCEYVVDVYTNVENDSGGCIDNLLPFKKSEYCSIEVIDYEDVEDWNVESKYIVEYPDECICEGSQSTNSNDVDIAEYMEGMAINELPTIEPDEHMTED